MRAHLILAIVSASSIALLSACAAGSSSPMSPTSMPSGGNASTQMTDADWEVVIAQFASIGVTTLQHALPSVIGNQSVSTSAQFAATTLRPADLTKVDLGTYGETDYWPSLDGPNFMATSGHLVATVDTSGSGTISVAETITSGVGIVVGCPNGECETTQQLRLDGNGLKITSDLVVVTGQAQPEQRLRLTGNILWLDPHGDWQTKQIDLFLGYKEFPADPPQANGQIGSSPINTTFPAVPAPVTESPASPVPLPPSFPVGDCTGSAPSSGGHSCNPNPGPAPSPANPVPAPAPPAAPPTPAPNPNPPPPSAPQPPDAGCPTGPAPPNGPQPCTTEP